MNLNFLTDEQVAILQELINQHRRTITGGQFRNLSESAWSDKEDHQAPGVYVCYPIDDPDSDEVGGTGSGTYWKAAPSLIIPGIVRTATSDGYDEIFRQKCRVYRILANPSDETRFQLHTICAKEEKDECYQWVYNLSETSVADQYVTAIRDAYGNFIAQPNTAPVKVMLAEDHPGRHTPNLNSKRFKVWPGRYCAEVEDWLFDVDAGEDDQWDAVDNWNPVTGFVWPDKYAQAWTYIKSAPDAKDGIIYHVYTGDCEAASPTPWDLSLCKAGT